jgi:hypothetical protein
MVAVPLLLALAAAPEVALLSTQGDVTELRFQPLGARELVAPAVRFSHTDDADVHGALLPGSRVVVATAVLQHRRDLSFAGALIRLEAGAPPRVLADEVTYASRPLVTAEGRVFVSRGVAGPVLPLSPGDYRVDALTIEEIDPATAARRLVYATTGYLAFLAGALGRELLVYEIAPAGARLLAVHVDTLGAREVLSAMPPLARDFVVDAPRKRVLFTQGSPGADAWRVEAVDLVTGALTRLVEGPEVALLPTALPDGRVLVSDGPARGLRALDGGRGLPATGVGFERVELVSGPLVLGTNTGADGTPTVFAWQDGRRVPVATPPQQRLELAGVRR